MGSVIENGNDDLNQALLPKHQQDNKEDDLTTRVWVESKKLWHIVGPAIFSRVASFSMNVITQAFAGHLGDVQLAAISIANTVIVGFNFGLLVRNRISNYSLYKKILMVCICVNLFNTIYWVGVLGIS